MTDHDQLFKQLLKAFFGDLLEIVAPHLAGELRPAAAKFLDKETFSGLPQGERAVVDLVAEVPAREGEPRLVLVHVEVEGKHRASMPERLWTYYMHLRLNYKLPVIPILITLLGGPPGVVEGEWIDEFRGLEIARFRYFSFGLSGSLAEEYLSRPQALAWGLAALMRSESWDRVEQKVRCLATIARAGVGEREELLLLNLVETYIELEGEEAARFAALVAREAEEAETMETTWAGKIEARARQEGLERGSLDGARRVVTRQLEHRFGPLPGDFRRRLEQVDEPERLDRLSERLLEARSLSDLEL